MNKPSHDHFWELWQYHHDSLQEHSLRLTRGNGPDADDLLGAALLRAARVFPKHSKAIKNLEAWLHQLLYNTFIDGMAQRQRYTRKPPLPEAEWDEELALGDERPSAEELLMRRQRSSWLWKQVELLPDSWRAPVFMRFRDGMSYSAIAADLHLTECNVRKRIQLACGRLRQSLASEL